MTARERQLEELLSALTRLLDDMVRCRTCVLNPDGACRESHALSYKRLRERVRRELSRPRPN